MEETQPPAPQEQEPTVQAAPQKQQQQQELPKKLLKQPKNIGSPISGKLDQLKRFIIECKRVLRVTKKPNKEEFQTIVKISSIGMILIGLIGFAVFFLKEIIIG